MSCFDNDAGDWSLGDSGTQISVAVFFIFDAIST